ncbi:Cytokinin hydroxylase [Dendrobium catenatum]|uniref:Cytokinin hydroxylase n=1 Tax=Dendrobium catenatum TaxID=906689 RepID=A0A2I0XFL7_9ASPA|nr:Cytokinin hydroxylase [Dendrobium catenatum]
MADPELDSGFAYDEQGNINILHSTFDFNPETDNSDEEYVDYIIFTLSEAVEDQLANVQWQIVSGPRQGFVRDEVGSSGTIGTGCAENQFWLYDSSGRKLDRLDENSPVNPSPGTICHFSSGRNSSLHGSSGTKLDRPGRSVWIYIEMRYFEEREKAEEREKRRKKWKSGFSGDAELFSSKETVQEIAVRKENCVNSVYCRCTARFLSNFCFVRKSSELICYLYMLYKGIMEVFSESTINQALCLGLRFLLLFFLSFFFSRIFSLFWLSPVAVRRQLRRSGFDGPPPTFPLGNLTEISWALIGESTTSKPKVRKVFIYWLGTEPFLYISDPEFLKKVSSGGLGKKWGKPNVFKNDRKPMFGNGLIMADGDDWTHNRHIIAPAFSTTNLNENLRLPSEIPAEVNTLETTVHESADYSTAMFGMMVDSTTTMLDGWRKFMSMGIHEMDVEKDITRNAAEIIAKTSFGISEENGKKVFEKLQSMQSMLFKSNRFVGVPFSKILSPKKSYEAWILGKEIDELLLQIINSRMEKNSESSNGGQDLLGLLLARNDYKKMKRTERKLSSRVLVDECKTFFFGGHETTALALTWTLLLLGLYPEWQKALREEIKEVSGGEPLNSNMLAKLTKMGWVWNEILRLYSPAPNVQRQAKEKVVVGEVTIPKGTNMWIDVVGMHHDPTLWGDDVNEFKPERFKDSINGGCKHRMGFMPFGFGGRICIGRNLTLMEYKIVLSLILCKFSISISPTYVHSPEIMLSLRPSQGVPLILHPLEWSEV